MLSLLPIIWVVGVEELLVNWLGVLLCWVVVKVCCSRRTSAMGHGMSRPAVRKLKVEVSSVADVLRKLPLRSCEDW